MKVYLVGGAVRDELLRRPVKDCDYVVVGSTPAAMLAMGFEQVGADFPVFLHPSTKSEHALARTERKSGAGYHGFEVNADSTVTLEEDLRRRDLTINAMAKNLETGEVVDPFSGQRDLANGILRHVSEAFAEDPVRVLRVARFATRYNFEVAHETVELMNKLATSGELQHLTVERVWNELEKAMSERFPQEFIYTLRECDALLELFPEVCGSELATEQLFRAAVRNKLTPEQRFALLTCKMKYSSLETMLVRLKAPTAFATLALRTNQWLRRTPMTWATLPYEPACILETLDDLNAWRDPATLFAAAECLQFMHSDRHEHYFVERVLEALGVANTVTFASLTVEQQKTLKGKEVGKAIAAARLDKLKASL